MTPRDNKSQQTLNQEIGAAIRDARMARGVTQEELARAFGVDRVTIARYERGTRTVSAPTLLQLLSFLGRDLPLGTAQPSLPPEIPARVRPADPLVDRVVQVLQERPELAATVKDLFETLEVWPSTEP